jgi:hypothetical protein
MVPFFSNQPDDIHCFQASIKMILKYFLPNRDFSWEELEKMSAITSKKDDPVTWTQPMLLHLAELGFEVALVEEFDAEAFITEGEGYLRRAYSKENAEWQIARTDIPQEQEAYRKLLGNDAIAYENRTPDIEDIREYLLRGYLVQVTINHSKLNGEEGNKGHSIVVISADDINVVFHDPGLPGQENRVESVADFQAAWTDPHTNTKLVAIKYKEPI